MPHNACEDLPSPGRLAQSRFRLAPGPWTRRSGPHGRGGTLQGRPGLQYVRICLVRRGWSSRRGSAEVPVAASAAPSIHNTQPWLFRPRGRCVDVLVDRRRQLATLDPDGREMFVSVGAAVFNLRVAVRAGGPTNRVSLLPDPSEPRPGRACHARSEGRPARRSGGPGRGHPPPHTNRRPFADRPVPYGTMEELTRRRELENAVLDGGGPAAA